MPPARVDIHHVEHRGGEERRVERIEVATRPFKEIHEGSPVVGRCLAHRLGANRQQACVVTGHLKHDMATVEDGIVGAADRHEIFAGHWGQRGAALSASDAAQIKSQIMELMKRRLQRAGDHLERAGARPRGGMKFHKPDSDTWQLVPADDVSDVDSRTQKLAAQAKEFLQRVVTEHPGTPWALLAAEELETPIGYRWEERHTGVNKPAMNAGNNNNNLSAPQDDKKKKLAPPKPKRNLKNV